VANAHEKSPARFPPGLPAQLFQIPLFHTSHSSKVNEIFRHEIFQAEILKGKCRANGAEHRAFPASAGLCSTCGDKRSTMAGCRIISDQSAVSVAVVPKRPPE
jgi:hypothetical protein